MKIVFVTSSFYPSIGGVETHVLEISRILIKLGHKVTVITEDKSEYWQSKSRSDNKANRLKSIDKSIYCAHKKLYQIDIYYFKFGQPSFFKKFKIWYLILRSISLFEDADIIHVHDVFIWYLPLRFVLFHKKVFTTFHGYETVFPPHKKAIFIRKISEALSFGNICIGNFIKKWYGTNPDFVLYGGIKQVSSSKYQAASKKENMLSTTKYKILLVGRLEKDMGIQIYKETFKKLKDRGIKFDLTVCGGGIFQEELEVYGKVLGFVPKIEPYLKNADLVFASSYLIMLQALAFGKPVFSIYTNPLKHDYLRDSPFGNFIFVSHTADELTKQIVKYKLNLKRLEKGARWARYQTWEKVAQVYLELWNKK